MRAFQFDSVPSFQKEAIILSKSARIKEINYLGFINLTYISRCMLPFFGSAQGLLLWNTHIKDG